MMKDLNTDFKTDLVSAGEKKHFIHFILMLGGIPTAHD